MKIVALILAMGAALAEPAPRRTFSGLVTDTMCGKSHSMMKIAPDDKCIRECARAHGGRYALLTGGKVHILHDQKTPEKFAGKRVKLTGVLYEKTNIIKFDSIEEDK